MRSDMNEPFPDELLSAYLDGELPREERARVEDWLTASAEHRRLLDDLKAIRRELQALPKQSLDAGFSDRVLAAIRQRSGEPAASLTTASGSSPAAESAETIPVKPVNLPDKRLGLPAWRWFAAGVAATLLAVIVGMNAAPQTMAQIGRMAQVVRQNKEVPTKKEAPQGYAATPVPGEEGLVTVEGSESGGSGSGARQREPSALAEATNKDRGETFAYGAQKRKESAPGEQVAEPQAEVPAPSTPKVEADAVLAARAALESFDKNYADSDGRETLANEAKKSAPGGMANGQTAVAYDDVIELPVTGEQADRALAFYARTVGQQAARRYRNSTVATLAVPSDEEKESGRFAESSDRETVLQRSGPGLALMKLMDAATQGVQVAALDVTGPEAEVQALLDSLGVDQARDLRPSRESFGGGAGEIDAFRATREAEQSAAGGSEAKPATAAGKVVAKADGGSDKTEEAKGGSPAPKGASRGGANGGIPLVKMRSVYEGNESTRDQAKRALASQAEGGDASQPQLRVRLVFVPAQTDPIGPTIEMKPTE